MAKTKDAPRSIMGDKVMVSLDQLKLYPDNPRIGNVDLIAESLVENGQFQPLVVQKSTGYILAGNHTYKAAKKLGWSQIEVVYVDADDERAKKVVLAANRTSDLASYDTAILADILSGLPDAKGTGYDEEAVSALLESVKTDNHEQIEAILRPVPAAVDRDDDDIEWGEPDNSVGGKKLPDFLESDFDVDIKGPDEEDDPLLKADEHLKGAFQLQPDASYEHVGELHIPPLIPSMLMTPDEVPPNLLAWAGSATKDWPDPEQWWLYNVGIDSTSGMKDVSKCVIGFYCWDNYFESWWDYPDRWTAKLLNSGIKYAISPDFSQWTAEPRIISLFNLYRNRWLARYMQEAGIKIIPNISWRYQDPEYYDRWVRPTLPKKLPVVALQLQTWDEKMTDEDKAEQLKFMEHVGESLDPELTIFYVGKQAREIMDQFEWPGEKMIIANRLDALGEQAKNRVKKKTL